MWETHLKTYIDVLFAIALLTTSESYYIEEQLIFSSVKPLFEITIRVESCCAVQTDFNPVWGSNAGGSGEKTPQMSTQIVALHSNVVANTCKVTFLVDYFVT